LTGKAFSRQRHTAAATEGSGVGPGEVQPEHRIAFRQNSATKVLLFEQEMTRFDSLENPFFIYLEVDVQDLRANPSVPRLPSSSLHPPSAGFWC
jgi:hypothetical protein